MQPLALKFPRFSQLMCWGNTAAWWKLSLPLAFSVRHVYLGVCSTTEVLHHKWLISPSMHDVIFVTDYWLWIGVGSSHPHTEEWPLLSQGKVFQKVGCILTGGSLMPDSFFTPHPSPNLGYSNSHPLLPSSASTSCHCSSFWSCSVVALQNSVRDHHSLSHF